MSLLSSGKLLILPDRGPCLVLVVVRAGLDAAVEDADEAVAELTQGCAVAGAAGAELIVVGAGPQ